MLFILGEIVMRLLSKRQVKEMVLYSPQHIARLEKAGQFPKRVQLGLAPTSTVPAITDTSDPPDRTNEFKVTLSAEPALDDFLEAAERAAALAKERTDLITKAKKLAKLGGGGGGGGDGGGEDGSFFRAALEHQFDGVDRGCLDEGGEK